MAIDQWLIVLALSVFAGVVSFTAASSGQSLDSPTSNDPSFPDEPIS